jgi:hypothetical protein
MKNGAVDARGKHGDINAHTMATLVLCQLYLLTGDPDLKAISTACLKHLVQQQDAKTGGWPRKPGETPTLATHVWPVLALQCGRWAKLADVSKSQKLAWEFLNARRFKGGLYYTDAEGHKSPLATARAVLCRSYFSENLEGRAGAEVAKYLVGKDRPLHDAEYDFLVTLILYHRNGAVWSAWDKKQKAQLIPAQQQNGLRRGSWYDAKDRQAKKRGQLYQTAMRAMSLEVYYRLLPIYGHGRDDEEKEGKKK